MFRFVKDFLKSKKEQKAKIISSSQFADDNEDSEEFDEQINSSSKSKEIEMKNTQNVEVF
jgi:hypothetical protein